MINKLRSSSEAKVSCCNIKVPTEIKLQIDKHNRNNSMKKALLSPPGGKKKSEMTEASKAVIERKYKELQYRK